MTADREIFVNLPVANLENSMAFFRALGFEFNLQFTNDEAACMIIGEKAFAMLLSRPFFEGFIPGRAISDTSEFTEVLLAVSAPDREAVDATIARAEEAGGREFREVSDYGWMYCRCFQDPDGHIWEMIAMDESQMPGDMSEESE